MTGSRAAQAWFHDLATHYVEAQVLFHLNQVGVFDMLVDRGPIGAAEMAERLGLDRGVLEVLLDYVSGVDDIIAGDGESGYRVTELGRQILERFGRTDPDGGRHFNFFDVRVGAYGPVWAALTGMLRGDVVYQRDVIRKGGLAAEATYKVSPHIAPMVTAFSLEHGIERLVEIGVPTGLLSLLCPTLPAADLIGLDVDEAALEEARTRAARAGAARVRFVRGDVFEPASWRDRVGRDRRGAFFTVHMHELASRGLPAIRSLVSTLAELFPGWRLLAIEQDRLPPESRAALPRDEWQYSQSNVLIHHLIRNARILRKEEWTELFTSPRSRVASVKPIGYLGYHGYDVELGEGLP